MERRWKGIPEVGNRVSKDMASMRPWYTEVAGTFRHGREWQETRLEEGDQAKFGEI